MSRYTPLLAVHDMLTDIKGCSSDKWRFVTCVEDGEHESAGEVSAEYAYVVKGADGVPRFEKHWAFTLKPRATSVLISFRPGLLDADVAPESEQPAWLSDGQAMIKLSRTLEVTIDWGWDSCSCTVSPEAYESSGLHRGAVRKLLLLAQARLILKLGVAPLAPIRPLE